MKLLDSEPGTVVAEARLTSDSFSFFRERGQRDIVWEELLDEIQTHRIAFEVLQSLAANDDRAMVNACFAILADNLKHGRIDETTLKMLRTSRVLKHELAREVRTGQVHLYLRLKSETFHLPEVSVRSTMQVLDAESPRRLTLRRVRETNVQSIAPEK